MNFKILVIDDEPTLRDALHVALTHSGYEVFACRTGEEGLDLFPRENPDLVLLDHWLPGINGDEVLRRIRNLSPEIPVIIMTAQGSIELAVQLMKLGAFDFLVKPFELEQIEALVQKGLEKVRLKKELEWLRAQYQEKFRSGGIIRASKKMEEVLGLAEKLAQSSDTTVLIEGETGTGKELLAEYIHFLSPRANFPFIPINCGAIPRDLFESELFGYEKGAFTGAGEKGKIGKVETAQKGALFLDEVGELPPPAQVKVLRILESKEYSRVGGVEKRKADIRVIAATNKDLEEEVRNGNFRDDLYFRLNVVRLYVPPLRERREDILPLFRFFLTRFNDQFQKRFSQISKEAEAYLLQYSWPGNVRELRNAAERVVLMEKGDTILERHFSFLTGKEEVRRSQPAPTPFIPPQGIVWDEVEKVYLEEALRLKKGNKIQAARLLGITRSALLYRMEKHGLK
ncbi:MAG: sigma-54-dependent Fis family transcriptional regulator [Deltaproteobacteria bacterium]|nr:MAG: sigma-54-dependent Fis family transcriptional regulator [Deltaproteobacteria bacterium]